MTVTLPFGSTSYPSGTAIKRRYVASLDILGFRSRLRKVGLAAIHADYANFRLRIRAGAGMTVAGTLFGQLVGGRITVPFIVLSDTVLLWCDEDGDADVFIGTCAGLVADSLSDGIPLRGGIAFGDTIIDASTHTYLGQPLVDAYVTETVQEWIGVGLHSSAAERLHKCEDVVAYDVPIKTKTSRLVHLAHPSLRMLATKIMPESQISRALLWHHYLHGSDVGRLLTKLRGTAERSSDRRKYDNALAFVATHPPP